MRVMFVYWPYVNAGSATDLAHYSRAARAMGHEIVVFAPRDSRLPFECDQDVSQADLVVFVLEWNLYLHHGGRMNLVRLLADSQRTRRIVVDCDGMYNDAIQVEGDCNHLSAAMSARRTQLCDALSGAVYQPTLHPLRRHVQSFLFHAYDAEEARPLSFANKPFDMIYVGTCWFRWRPLHRVLRAIERIGGESRRMALVGAGWDRTSQEAAPYMPRDAYFVDAEYLRKLGIQVLPPVPFQEVFDWMGKGIFNPVIYRPLFTHLRFVTCRTFETVAANTVPLFAQDALFVREIYGDAGLDLMLGEDPCSKILDVLRRPESYTAAVEAVRRHLAAFHSYEARFRQLLAIAKSGACGPRSLRG